jgi:hypothetical protein
MHLWWEGARLGNRREHGDVAMMRRCGHGCTGHGFLHQVHDELYVEHSASFIILRLRLSSLQLRTPCLTAAATTKPQVFIREEVDGSIKDGYQAKSNYSIRSALKTLSNFDYNNNDDNDNDSDSSSAADGSQRDH